MSTQLQLNMIDPGVKEGICTLINSLLEAKKKTPIQVHISKFKKIDSAVLELESLNIFIGTNNSGKSSFIQGIQFAVSSCQTLTLKKVNWVKKTDIRTLALDSTDFLYTPTKQIDHLYHGTRLTGAKNRDDRKWISFGFAMNGVHTQLHVSRGRNGGFTTSQHGRKLGETISSIDNPFCVYVPGIAGIPIQEKYEVPIAIKKSATRGDSNNYLRNIILDISRDKSKWSRFHTSLNRVYPDVAVRASFDMHTSEYISVSVRIDNLSLPIDSIGTGILQTIQIFAYIEYFNPQLLLLDEPDSHIHPTKQKYLAEELYSRTLADKRLKIVFSTHSRYILQALEDRAQVIHFQNGRAYPNIKGSDILVDIGAADADYLFSKKQLKYVIVTEDKVDNIEQKKEFLRKFIIANGLKEDEFVLHSYESCTKIHFAKLLEGFVRKHIPQVKVIVHVDRDQRVGSDRGLIQIENDCAKQDIKLFLTEMSEVENYFCNPSHISAIYDLELELSEQIYESNVRELENETRAKLTNFLVRERNELCLNKDGNFDIRAVNRLVDEQYEKHSNQITPGKELLGRIKNQLQQQLKLTPSLIVNVSEGLFSPSFAKLLGQE